MMSRYSQMPIVRSVRHKPGQAASPAEAASHPSKMMDPQWRQGYRLVAENGLLSDLQVAWWHMREAVDLARSYPQQTIIVNHAALPSDRSPEMMQGWSRAVHELAACQNTVMKISGIGLPSVPWRAENNRLIVETLFEAFGSQRIMFASNFPVDSLCGSYDDIFGGFLEISRDWSPDEQSDAFIGTAVRTYGLEESLLSRVAAPARAYGTETSRP
ncbi:hypothetical protein EFN19_05060 [Propionibacterium freudenreichii]|nr:hypothetical protein [Propionibacterium freudenreichii]